MLQKLTSKEIITHLIVAVFTALVAFGGTFTTMRITDATNIQRIETIENSILCIDKIKKEQAVILEKQAQMNYEINLLRENTFQLQKTTNTLSSQLMENSEANKRTVNVLDRLNDSIAGLNTTIARLDERLKTIEKKTI